MEYDVLILGHLIPKALEDEVIKKTKGFMQFSSTPHLNMIIDSIKNSFEGSITLLNFLPVGSYPKRYKDLWINDFDFKINDKVIGKNAKYFNLTLIKKLSKRNKAIRETKKWAKNNNGKKKVLFLYAVMGEYLTTAKIIKKMFPHIHICLIVPDLPMFTDIDKGEKIIYKLRAKYRNYSMFKRINNIDSFVFLTSEMKNYFKTKKPYIVMEGIYSENPYFGEYKDNGEKILAYTGTFTKKYGILDLLLAFSYIKDTDYKLIIAGSGEGEKEIIEYAKIDKRIIYKGSVSRSEALRIQANATININPRKADWDFTKYSFPSKIMEYLSSGRPTLCFKLPGIPNEYDEFIYYFKDSDPKMMAEDIKRICEIDKNELSKKGELGKEFVKECKNTRIQGLKIKSMIIDSQK